MNMDLHKRLEILEREYCNMKKYYHECVAIGSILTYTSIDFDREGYLLDMIRKTKDLLKGQSLRKGGNNEN